VKSEKGVSNKYDYTDVEQENPIQRSS